LVAILLASSFVSKFAAARRPGSLDVSKLLPIRVAHDEAGVVEYFNRPAGGMRRGEGMPMTALSSMTAMVGVEGGTLAARPASFAPAAKVQKQSCYSI
jgi:hypothetical protein